MEFSPLIPKNRKAAANVFGLIFGPFIMFVLYVADRTKKIEQGEMAASDILKDFINNILRKTDDFPNDIKIEDNSIELLDSAGRSFYEVYGPQSRSHESNLETLDFTKSIIQDAIEKRASDILVDPKGEGFYSIRFRIDGFLRTVSQVESNKCVAIINSIKVVAGMDIAEKRRPQDGAFIAKISDDNVFFRVASAGVLGGEKLSIRVLNQSVGLLNLKDIGISSKHHESISDFISQPSGMIIVCGPTGSGKTTSLYAMLNNINYFERNVVTVEDPVEYVLPNVSQIEVNPRANITFANSLRSILRQDPDVICVGEIRDAETAAMALQASQTGHLVLATLHGSSNMSALVRLMDLGVKPLMLASALNVIISQRLVRKLCEYCKSPAHLSGENISHFEQKGVDSSEIMQANGCNKCQGTGYSGRIGIFDILYMDDKLKSSIVNNKLSPGDLKKQGDEKVKSTLKKEGMKKVLAGITTLDEVKRVISNLG